MPSKHSTDPHVLAYIYGRIPGGARAYLGAVSVPQGEDPDAIASRAASRRVGELFENIEATVTNIRATPPKSGG